MRHEIHSQLRLRDVIATLDKIKRRDARKNVEAWYASRRAEKTYAIALRKVARQVGDLVKGFDIAEADFASKVAHALGRYAELIKPWAFNTARRVVLEISRRDEQAWAKVSQEMGRSLRQEIKAAPVGTLLQAFMRENVNLITSLPLEAGLRVHRLALEARANSARSKDIAKEIMRTGEVTQSRATLIARTEVARTGSALTQQRAMHVGSEAYIWRTAKDSDVRPSHAAMESVLVRWDSPPTLIDGTTTHAGQIYNCRCWAEPVIPDKFD